MFTQVSGTLPFKGQEPMDSAIVHQDIGLSVYLTYSGRKPPPDQAPPKTPARDMDYARVLDQVLLPDWRPSS